MANNIHTPATSSQQQQADPLTTALLTFKTLTETYILPTLPPPLSTILQTTLRTTTSMTPYLASTYTTFSRLTSNFLVSQQPQQSSSSSSSSKINTPESKALITTLTLLLSIYLSLKILNYIRRTILSWILFFVKMGVFLVLVQVGWYVHMYGWEKFLGDASWWGGVVWGLIEDFVEGDGNASSGARGRKVPRGMRSRGDARRMRGNHNNAYAGYDGGRTRW